MPIALNEKQTQLVGIFNNVVNQVVMPTHDEDGNLTGRGATLGDVLAALDAVHLGLSNTVLMALAQKQQSRVVGTTPEETTRFGGNGEG